jgi:regulator of protease activity HflC (stomatin/prohibitin superfamily)
MFIFGPVAKLGNPIMIGIVLVWRVEETFKAAFEVDNYELFVKIQSESAIRKLAGLYPYDTFDDSHEELSLRSGGNEINHQLEEELRERLAIAGISVIEARISNLAYASEIAGAMLQRQQATAVVAARTKIVEGAVGMVEMALKELSAKSIIELDDERKAAMVSNLMVVLCSDKSASPVINTGTINH